MNYSPQFSKSAVDKFSLLLVFILSSIGEGKAHEACHTHNRRLHESPSVDQFVIYRIPSHRFISVSMFIWIASFKSVCAFFD